MRFPSLFCALLLALFTLLPSSLTLPVSINLMPASRQTDTALPDIPRVPPEFNINSGGPAAGRFIAEDPQWIIGDTSAFAVENAVIGGAEQRNQVMYKSHRYGLEGTPWGYDIPVMEPGVYGCTIHFAETHADAFSDGARVFDLSIFTNFGQPTVFSDIDIFKELEGAEFTVLTKTVLDLVVPGFIFIRVDPSAGDAIISGVTCERTADLPEGVQPDFGVDPTIPTVEVGDTEKGEDDDSETGVMVQGTEININAGGPEVGRFIAEDYAWIFGTTSLWGGPEGIEIGGAEEKNVPALVSQRYGIDGSTWGYRIPIEMPGLYDCSLHFAETDSSSFEIGARVFNVRVQDSKFENVDVFSESGEAPFTSVVKTLLGLQVANELYIELSSVTGNAFLSAITCERTGELASEDTSGSSMSGQRIEMSPTAELGVTPEPSSSPFAVAILPGASDSPMPIAQTEPASVIETPDVDENVVTSSAEGDVGVVESPSAEYAAEEGSSDEEVEPSSSPVIEGEAGETSDVNKDDATPLPTPSPGSSQFPLDAVLIQGSGDVQAVYKLRGEVSEGGEFTVAMKDALITLSAEATEATSRWALIDLRRNEIDETVRGAMPFVSRQAANSVYQIDLQAIYNERGNFTSAVVAYREFVNEDMNRKLQEQGIGNLRISFRETPALGGSNDFANVSNMSTVVGIIVGCVLALLVIIALAAFFVVRRSRNNLNAAAFDAPPPMTESEMSSVMERSETGASIEYLDDDSTFTAATSRAGDHVDQVAIDKDVFGRRSAPDSQ